MKDEMGSNDTGEELPDAAKAALRKRFGRVPDVPSNIDQSILADARRHFEQHGPAALRPTRWRRVSAWQWTAIGSTVAAACVLFFAITPNQPQQETSLASDSIAESSEVELTSDVDRNGRVDILDAFAMAREIRGGRGGFRDLNGDGLFDQQDVDLVAQEAVKL